MNFADLEFLHVGEQEAEVFAGLLALPGGEFPGRWGWSLRASRRRAQSDARLGVVKEMEGHGVCVWGWKFPRKYSAAPRHCFQ